MEFVNPSGEKLSAVQWYRQAAEMGMGVPLSETTAPGALGDITIRTVWTGISGSGFRPFRTMRLVVGRRLWETLEEYDADTAAMAGHMLWIRRLTPVS